MPGILRETSEGPATIWPDSSFAPILTLNDESCIWYVLQPTQTYNFQKLSQGACDFVAEILGGGLQLLPEVFSKAR